MTWNFSIFYLYLLPVFYIALVNFHLISLHKGDLGNISLENTECMDIGPMFGMFGIGSECGLGAWGVIEIDYGREVTAAAGVGKNARNDAVSVDEVESCERKGFIVSLHNR
jgi:hypothetical protein